MMAELAKIEMEDRGPTKKVPRLASDCEGAQSTLSGTHEANVNISKASRKSFCIR